MQCNRSSDGKGKKRIGAPKEVLIWGGKKVEQKRAEKAKNGATNKVAATKAYLW